MPGKTACYEDHVVYPTGILFLHAKLFTFMDSTVCSVIFLQQPLFNLCSHDSVICKIYLGGAMSMFPYVSVPKV